MLAGGALGEVLPCLITSGQGNLDGGFRNVGEAPQVPNPEGQTLGTRPEKASPGPTGLALRPEISSWIDGRDPLRLVRESEPTRHPDYTPTALGSARLPNYLKYWIVSPS